MTAHRLIAVVASGAAILAVGTGLYFSGSPAEERFLRLDERRVADLQMLAAAIDLHWYANEALPSTFAELRAARRITVEPVDPASGEPYHYELLEEGRYRLCALFDRPSRERQRAEFWAHGPQRQCFDITPQAVASRARVR